MEPLSPSRYALRSNSTPYGGRQQPTPRRSLTHRPTITPDGYRNTISLQALTQRLSLLAAIELPCAVQLGDLDCPRGGSGRIRSCGCRGGCFQLAGDDFSLRLNEAAINSVRLAEHTTGDRGDTCIELVAVNGTVLARIQGPPDRSGKAVWQDIMDTFDCA